MNLLLLPWQARQLTPHSSKYTFNSSITASGAELLHGAQHAAYLTPQWQHQTHPAMPCSWATYRQTELCFVLSNSATNLADDAAQNRGQRCAPATPIASNELKEIALVRTDQLISSMVADE
jgi:hypothetical protein